MYDAQVAHIYYEIQNVKKKILITNKTISDKVLLSSTQNNLRIAELTYENGIITYLDVLDAQLNHSNAQQDLSNAVNDMQDAVVTLYTSLCGGWDASIFIQQIENKPQGE